MKLIEYEGEKPQIADSVFLASGSKIIGEVIIKAQSSIWYNAVLRGDLNRIVIGEKTNIQDNCTLHVDTEAPLLIGENVTIGHGAIVHGCEIKDNCLIGMGAKILNNAFVGRNSFIGAGAVVTPGTEIPENSMVMGVPGKVVRKLRAEEKNYIQHSAERYFKLAGKHVQ